MKIQIFRTENGTLLFSMYREALGYTEVVTEGQLYNTEYYINECLIEYLIGKFIENVKAGNTTEIDLER